ncbi:MAG TPA: ATP synthase F0 subunit B [Terriglobales bacterium]|nr:ATP synthase F0 subunit B [Terriglobales bacterium]
MSLRSSLSTMLVRFALLSFLLGLPAVIGVAQEAGNAPEVRSQNASDQPSEQKDSKKAERPGFGAQLAKETREAAGEDDENAQFKQSASVRWLSKFTGGNLQHAYWLAMLLNFAVIAGVVFWAGKKFLPGAFRARTAAIQRAMEEARRASEDANRRLSDIESRLARLGDEISSMKTAGDADLAAEEARIKAAAEEDARKIVSSAEQEIAAASKAARRDLTAYAADLAIALAKKQIHVDSGTDSNLVRNFADRLGSAEDGGKN